MSVITAETLDSTVTIAALRELAMPLLVGNAVSSTSWLLGVVLGHYNPQTEDDVRAAIEFVEHFTEPGQPIPYEGYTEILCANARDFAYEAITHFIGEGLNEAEAHAYSARVLGLFAPYYQSITA